MSTPSPIARVLSVRELQDTRIVSVACPYCRRTHQHGWPWEAPDIGHRLAHCDHPGGYVIPTPTNEKKETQCPTP